MNKILPLANILLNQDDANNLGHNIANGDLESVDVELAEPAGDVVKTENFEF